MAEKLDCLVIGSGPAGLLASVYLGRFRRSVMNLDSGASRAALIPRTRNVPAYPNGISGRMLLARLRQQAGRYGSEVVQASVSEISGGDGDFRVATELGMLAARKIILATGVEDVLPDRFRGLRTQIRSGRIRLCPVCDAYELMNRPIFVLGRSEHGAREALFLHDYSPKLTLLTDGAPANSLSKEWRKRLEQAEIEVVEEPILSIKVHGAGVFIELCGENRRRAKALYVALGVTVRAALATELGARCDAQGYLEVDRHQETTVPGLYAAGDVVQSLSQISVGFGQAAIAAAAIHQALRAHREQQRSAPNLRPVYSAMHTPGHT